MASASPPTRITGLPGLEDAIKNAKRELPLMTRDDVEALIADGRKIIIAHDQVLKVDPWLKHHPGGDLSILHLVGKDASDEIDAFVTPQLSGSQQAIKLTLLLVFIR